MHDLQIQLDHNLNQTLYAIRQTQGQQVEHSSENELRIKRNSGTGCSSGQVDNSIGNLGFNSFNFLTFMILTFNAITNVNNNINNNNNNNNDISLNSISQTSQNTISNSDNSNDIMVMILPMPGGRKKRALHQNNNIVKEKIALEKLWSSISDFIDEAELIDIKCEPYRICNKFKIFQADTKYLDVLFINLLPSKKTHSLLSRLNCSDLFPHCSKRRT